MRPGFIDLQINGGYGIDLVTERRSMWELARRLPAGNGCSGTGSSCRSPSGFMGAAPLGLHLEGPMLRHERRGAHQARFLTKADLSVIEGWSATAGITLVTLAPELPGAFQIIEHVADCEQERLDPSLSIPR